MNFAIKKYIIHSILYYQVLDIRSYSISKKWLNERDVKKVSGGIKNTITYLRKETQ